jgi:hypothetical protein
MNKSTVREYAKRLYIYMNLFVSFRSRIAVHPWGGGDVFHPGFKLHLIHSWDGGVFIPYCRYKFQLRLRQGMLFC